MLQNPDFITARELLLNIVNPVSTQIIPLSEAFARILAAPVTAISDVPPFNRSPYDGYALRSPDLRNASRETPVRLRIVEEIAAGSLPAHPLQEGEAAKILTGAPIPQGADAVIKFEDTVFSRESVTVFTPLHPGENIILAGEDIRAGQVLAETGQKIDAGLSGVLASQGIFEAAVFCRPVVGIISTGSEILPDGAAAQPGKIFNSNRYTFSAALAAEGCIPLWLGLAKDNAEEIRGLIQEGLHRCDAVLVTGGVSVGDYDVTPQAIELTGAEMLIRGVSIKPGMACAYAAADGKLICALSGNPASSLTNFYAVALPAIRKLCGHREPYMEQAELTLAASFPKRSTCTRLLRGRLSLPEGKATLLFSPDQGNIVLSSAIGCSAMAVVPAGSGPVTAGTILKGFLL